MRIDTIQSRIERKELDIFKKRLEKFIAYTKANKLYGEWNDNGRLLDYRNMAASASKGTGPPLQNISKNQVDKESIK